MEVIILPAINITVHHACTIVQNTLLINSRWSVNMSKQLLQLNNVFFKYGNSAENIFSSINIRFSKGWTGIAGTNGSGKTTLLKLASGILQPTGGSVVSTGTVYYCEQRTDEKPSGYRDFLSSYEKRSYRIRNLLGIEDEWFDRWHTLSHGERKRCQIATALFVNPGVLAIDEPTNHIDAETKHVLTNALRTFGGTGLIVSHDRQMLDELCGHILSIEQPAPKMRRGNYTSFEHESQKEYEHLVSVKENMNKEIKKLEQEVKRRKRKASEADKNRSKRNIASKDHDAKSKVDVARLMGKDATEGKIYSRLKTRMEKMVSDKSAVGSTAKRELGIKIEGSTFSKTVILYQMENKITLGKNRKLRHPDLYINRSAKIALTGNNGYGKSTLIRSLIPTLKSANVSFAYIPQEITSEQSALILKDAINLKHEDKGKIFTIISRLNSDPKRLLDSVLPSPGEVRKLMLAKALLDKHELIIMDEPTNHMDLPSIKCVEEALREYNGALLLVSHDKVFLDNVVDTYWKIKSNDVYEFLLNV